MMAEQMVKANPAYRVYGLLAVVLMTIVVGAMWFWGWPTLTRHLSQSPPAQALRWVRWLLTGLFAPCLLCAVYFTLVARRIILAGQFPPPGMVVIKDTKVQRGADAVRVSRLFAVAGAVLMLVGLIGGYYFPWVLLELFTAK
jgi:hypothetical protein